MVDFTRRYETTVDAPVHEVFESCRDPRHVFEGWPELQVTDVVMTPDGVGTTAHIVAKFVKGIVVEQIEREYTAVVPDQQIVSTAHATVRFAGRTKDVANAPIFTLLFEAEDGGTKLTLVLLEENLSRLANLYESVSGGAIEKDMRSMLAGIKVGAESHTSSAA